MKVFDAHSDIWSDVTAHRLAGGTSGSIFVIWVDPPYDAAPMARTRDIMAAVRAELGEDGAVTVVHTYEEMMAARDAGKFYVFIGIEGLAAIGEDLERIDWYYEFGARHAGLTWNEANALATGVNGDTHSNCRALCDVPRNLTDEQLRAIRDLKGVVGLNAFNGFVDLDPARQDVEHLARHAAHMVDVMGIEHVGCGFDFFEFLGQDAMGSMTDVSPSTAGLADSSQVPNLFACFERMGMTSAEMEKIAFGNFHSLIRRVIG